MDPDLARALDALEGRLPAVLGRDRARLARRVRGLRRAARNGRDTPHALAEVGAAVERSAARVAARRAARPAMPPWPDLPIVGARERIATAVADHPVVVVCGETGSGKTTQLPKICLALGRGLTGTIGHTQPRRIAARSVARRIAEELAVPLGEAVGYQVRFEDRTGPDTLVKLMTDGILLAETRPDPWLARYDTIIVDEAHERSLNIDFLLGYLKALLERRDDLRVIVTSATIDPERFARHFGGAPVIEVSGRTYPVEIRYRPPERDDAGEIDGPDAVARALEEAFREGPGDALVFLPGERHIRETRRLLERRFPEVACIPLYARLSADAQHRIFQPHRDRRVVLATNVAETSLTVPGIRYVVDTGLARVHRYSNRRKVDRLPVERISQAAAAQRAGRCGRIEAGVCLRLYAERDYLRRDAHTAPQILRTNLAGVILRMKDLGLGDIEAFPFVDAPRPGMVRDGYETLYEIGAVADDGALTERGRALARLPIDPRLGRMLLEGAERGCLAELRVIVAALSVREPRERPPEARDDADRAHARFRHPDSDFLGILKLWRAYVRERRRLGSARLRRWCRTHHLSNARMREWYDVWRQLGELDEEAGLAENADPAPADAIHQAVLAGLLRHVGRRHERAEYRGAHGARFRLWPGSALASARPRWIVAAERVETTRLYARTVAPIDPRWIEPLASHLVLREPYDPHWNERRGRVEAYERVMLFGVEVVGKRRIAFGTRHPRQAREIFLRHALVHGRMRTRARFFRHNQALLEEVRDLEARARRTGLLADPEDRYAFYDARVPADVCSTKALAAWLAGRRTTEPRALFMRREDLLTDPAGAPEQARFPDELVAGSLRLPLSYRYEPGHPEDGVTLRVPREALPQLDRDRLAWLVPGYVHEKVVTLLRALPKARRRRLVPIPEAADALLAHMAFGVGSFYEALSRALERLGQPRLPVTAWDAEALPPHLRVRLEVVDRDERVLAAGRSLAAVRAALAPQPPRSGGGIEGVPEPSGLVAWSFGALPREVARVRGEARIAGYPALVDEGESVAIRVLDTSRAAAEATRRGLVRLLALALRPPLRAHLRAVPELSRMRLWYGSLPTSVPLDRALGDAFVARAAGLDDPVAAAETEVLDARAFEGLTARTREALPPAAEALGPLVHAILARYHDVAAKLMLEAPAPFEASRRDMLAHLARLLAGDFLLETPGERLEDLPRHLDALDRRLVRLGQGGLAKDRAAMTRLAPHELRLARRRAAHAAEGIRDPALEAYRWMLEEWRVSLFAQELGTRIPASAKRLDRLWAQVRV